MNTENPQDIAENIRLMTEAFPLDPGEQWSAATVSGRIRYASVCGGRVVECATRAPGLTPGWTFGWTGCWGHGDDIPAAIADFRAKVAAEAVAVGAVKAAPVSGYTEVEAAIFGAAIVEQVAEARLLGRWPGNTAALMLRFIEEAEGIVEVYRATLK